MKKPTITIILSLVALVGMAQVKDSTSTLYNGTHQITFQVVPNTAKWYARSDGDTLKLNLKFLIKINDSTYKISPDTVIKSSSNYFLRGDGETSAWHPGDLYGTATTPLLGTSTISIGKFVDQNYKATVYHNGKLVAYKNGKKGKWHIFNAPAALDEMERAVNKAYSLKNK